MSSKDVEEALRKNRNLQNILNQRLARIQQAIEKNKKEMNLVKSSKPKTIFKMLNKSIYVKEDVDDATVGISLRPPLKQALDFESLYKEKHKYTNIPDVGLTYPSYFIDEDTCTYYLELEPELETCQEIIGNNAINFTNWSGFAMTQLKTYFKKQVQTILRQQVRSRLHPKSQMGDADAQKELDDEINKINKLKSDSNEIITFNPYQVKFSKGIEDKRENIYHTAIASKHKYIYEISKAFNTGPWTKEEDDILLKFSNKDKIVYWNKIIIKSILKRPLLSCIKRYKMLKKGNFKSKKEIPLAPTLKNENSSIINIDKFNGIDSNSIGGGDDGGSSNSSNNNNNNNNHNNTSSTTTALNSMNSIIQKKNKKKIASNNNNNVNWTKVEDDILGECMSTYIVEDKKILWDFNIWKIVVQKLSYGKSIHECKERWKELSKKQEKMDWKNEEIRRLTFATNALNGVTSTEKWPLVSKIMTNRNVTECRIQYKKIQKGVTNNKNNNGRKRRRKSAITNGSISSSSSSSSNNNTISKKKRKQKKEKLYMDDIFDISEF